MLSSISLPFQTRQIFNWISCLHTMKNNGSSSSLLFLFIQVCFASLYDIQHTSDRISLGPSRVEGEGSLFLQKITVFMILLAHRAYMFTYTLCSSIKFFYLYHKLLHRCGNYDYLHHSVSEDRRNFSVILT